MDLAILWTVLKELKGPAQKKATKVARGLAGKPSKEESKLLREYVRLLDERRVFFVRYDIEVVEACLGSLRSFKEGTEKVLSQLEHAPARAAVGAILDAIRSFLDRWHDFRTPRDPWDFMDGPPRGRRGRDVNGNLARFFEDLGELRLAVRLMVKLLKDIDSKIQAPNLLAAGG